MADKKAPEDGSLSIEERLAILQGALNVNATIIAALVGVVLDAGLEESFNGWLEHYRKLIEDETAKIMFEEMEEREDEVDVAVPDIPIVVPKSNNDN